MHGLRRGLTSYGDAEFSLFLRRAFIKAMGFSDAALELPIVGIANTYADYNPCHGNVPDLIEAVKRGVMLGGALPMVFPTITLHESFAHPTSMYLRNLMAMDTEEMMRAQPMDAVVLIGGCDKTLPAQMMAAASVNMPTVVLPVGPMSVGHHRGEVIGACTDCRRLWAKHRAGEMGQDELNVVNARLAPSAGTCMVMGTASTMACIAEALGLALPFSATAPATSAERRRLAEATGRRAAEIANQGSPIALNYLTPASFGNAIKVLQAIGGSANAVIHLIAIARRAGFALSLTEFDQAGRGTPVLVDVKPSGDKYMEDFHNAGGVPALLRELRSVLDLSAPGVLDRIAAAEEVPGQTVIRSTARPVNASGALAVLYGNLAPRGAVIKQSAGSEKLMQHTGPALVFDSIQDMTERIDNPDLEVDENTVLVLRNAGPKGAPGMPEAGYLPIPKKLARAGVRDMVRISDARMSGTAYGTVVVHVCPEAADRGPLALIRSGDLVRIDVGARKLDVLIAEHELNSRTPVTVEHCPARGYAKLFQNSVLQADEGCDFDFLSGI